MTNENLVTISALVAVAVVAIVVVSLAGSAMTGMMLGPRGRNVLTESGSGTNTILRGPRGRNVLTESGSGTNTILRGPRGRNVIIDSVTQTALVEMFSINFNKYNVAENVEQNIAENTKYSCLLINQTDKYTVTCGYIFQVSDINLNNAGLIELINSNGGITDLNSGSKIGILARGPRPIEAVE